jgi:hypothetical protein
MVSFVSIGLGLLPMFSSGATTFADPTPWWNFCYTKLHLDALSRLHLFTSNDKINYHTMVRNTSEALALGTKTGMSTRMIHSAIKSALGNSWWVPPFFPLA